LRGTLGYDAERAWESGRQTEILSRYPRAIALCGHAHRNVVDEYNLWQGAFTAVHVPSSNYNLTRYGHENGYHRSETVKVVSPLAPIHRSWQGLVGTLYGDRFEIERLDFLNGAKIADDWVIPLAPPDGSLSVARRAKKARPPAFARDAEVSVAEEPYVTRAKKTEDVIMVSFPEARSSGGRPRAFDYRVTVRHAGKTLAEKLVFSTGQFWAEGQRTLVVRCPFRKEEVPLFGTAEVTFAVTPRDSYGNEGPSISSGKKGAQKA
jgi:hypothetical protein